MELEPTGCFNCIACHADEYNTVFYCKAERKKIDKGNNIYPITAPSWCPLKIEPIIITLKEN